MIFVPKFTIQPSQKLGIVLLVITSLTLLLMAQGEACFENSPGKINIDMFQCRFEQQLSKELAFLKGADEETQFLLSQYVNGVNQVREGIGMGFRILEEAKKPHENVRMFQRHLNEVKEAMKQHGRESFEAAIKLWGTIMENWSRQGRPPLPEEPDSALKILQRWYMIIEKGLQIEGSELSRESIATLDALIQQSKSTQPSDSSVSPDYVIYECHCDDAGIKDADPIAFKMLLAQSVGIHPDSVVSLEICTGSLLVKALFPYQVTFNKVTKFNGSGNQQWAVTVVHAITATPEIEELVAEVKVNSQWLSIQDPNIKFDFLFSEPNMTPMNLINGTLVDFAMVDRFVTDSIEKSLLDLEIVDINFYGNSSFNDEFKKTLTPNSRLKYLFHGASQPDGFINDGFDEKRLGSTDPGWYGVGFYATSYLDYALCYQYQHYSFTRQDVLGYVAGLIRGRGGTLKMLLLVCNLGNCQTINRRIDGTKLANGVDSHYVRVQKGQPVPTIPDPDVPIYNEFVLKNKYALTPQFILTLRFRQPGKLLVWRSTSFYKYGDDATFKDMKQRFKGLTMVAYDCDDEALHRIDKVEDKTKVFVVTNRADGGDKFIVKCRAIGVKTPMLVFCSYAMNWIPMSGVTISTSGGAVQQFIQDVVLKS
jgi:hypothetical protein